VGDSGSSQYLDFYIAVLRTEILYVEHNQDIYLLLISPDGMREIYIQCISQRLISKEFVSQCARASRGVVATIHPSQEGFGFASSLPLSI